MKTRRTPNFIDALHMAATRRASLEAPSKVSLVLVDYSNCVNPSPYRLRRTEDAGRSSDMFLRDLEYIND
jgi:hypothetical protein